MAASTGAEQSLGNVTLLGGIYRVAERAGRARAYEWALASEQVPASVMAEAGVINRVVPDDQLRTEAETFAQKIAQGPTRAHVVHKALLRARATGGIPAADQRLLDLAVPLFGTEDVKGR
ncbi:enoyl-CoA hydratase-related protein [Streptomyces sp. NPDC005760]|uniref:enoyl-CoA hydratase/isomerase family protein n=1 Tax=Streptomyces sp. NPDC005760 TaxID=3156718 RepID=UPI0033F5821A